MKEVRADALRNQERALTTGHVAAPGESPEGSNSDSKKGAEKRQGQSLSNK